MFNEKVRGTSRGGRQMTEQELEDYLSHMQYGTLAYITKEGWPDMRPMNFGYHNGCLYFHTAKDKGEKLLHWADGTKVCVSSFLPAEDVGKSVICQHSSILLYGHLERLDGVPERADEAIAAITALCITGGSPHKAAPEYLEKCINSIGIFKIIPEYSVGKITRFSSMPETAHP